MRLTTIFASLLVSIISGMAIGFNQAVAAEKSASINHQPGSGIDLVSSDGRYRFELGGRIMIDYAKYRQDRTSLGDGTELRRARIELEGAVDDWAYEFGLDVADEDGAAELKDAYLAYLGWDKMVVKMGQFKQPFSLEEVTSSKYITFMERALANTFAPGRTIGVGLQTYGMNTNMAVGVFGQAYDEDEQDEGDESSAAAARLSYAPWHGKDNALHLGLSANYLNPSSSSGGSTTVDFNSRPESHITDVKYLDTGDITDVSRVVKYGVELAWVSGPWSLQGEYLVAKVERNSGQPALEFQGWYVYGSWFLTGESRHYQLKKGAFGRTRPATAGGAWELAYRVSSLDLNDQDISGGAATQHTLGLNWYANAHTRFMLNLINVDNDINADADGDATANDKPQIVQLRGQVDF